MNECVMADAGGGNCGCKNYFSRLPTHKCPHCDNVHEVTRQQRPVFVGRTNFEPC